MKIFYLFFASFILAHVWIFVDLSRWLGRGWWQLPVLVLFAGMIATWILRFGKPAEGTLVFVENASFIWLGFILISFMCFFFVDVIAIFLKILGLFWSSPVTRLLPAGRSVPLSLILGLCLTLYAVYEAQSVRITNYTIYTPKIAKGDKPVRVALLPDIHVGGFVGPKSLARMVNQVQEQKPDIIAVVGDLVDADVSGRHEEAAILARMQPPGGVFAVTGNHEGYRGLDMCLKFMKDANMKVLRSRGVDSCGIHVVGVDDLTIAERYGGKWNPTPVLKKYKGDKFVLLLKHRPGTPESAIGLFDLQISGHTHDGQIWPGGIVSRIVNKTRQGLSILTSGDRESRRIVSNGVGFWGPPMRLFAPPEIVIIDIAPER